MRPEQALYESLKELLSYAYLDTMVSAEDLEHAKAALKAWEDRNDAPVAEEYESWCSKCARQTSHENAVCLHCNHTDIDDWEDC